MLCTCTELAKTSSNDQMLKLYSIAALITGENINSFSLSEARTGHSCSVLFCCFV